MKLADKIYQNFIKLELISFKLEFDYSEKGEAEAINEIFSTWNNSKGDLFNIIENMGKNWNSPKDKKDKGYYG